MNFESIKRLPLNAEVNVRYIKLGEGGKWESECIEKNIIRFGFGTYKEERFALCMARRWDEFAKQFIADGKNQSTANRFTKETRLFFESDATTVWITFVGEYFYWGVLESTPPERYFDGDGVTEDERVHTIGPSELADLIIDAGLTSWLINKVK